jgi:ribosome maturation factor RimP
VYRYNERFVLRTRCFLRVLGVLLSSGSWFRLRPEGGLGGLDVPNSANVPVGGLPTLFLGENQPAQVTIVRKWMAADLNTIREIAGRVAAAQGIEVVDVELRGGGKARTLRITIDKPEGVTHEDCAMVSRDVSTILDVEDAVQGPAYTLEVSSPGLDRALKRPEDYRRFTGSRLKLTTREPVNGNRHFEARLQRFEEGKLILETIPGKKKPKPGHAQPVQQFEIDLANVEKANLVPEI